MSETQSEFPDARDINPDDYTAEEIKHFQDILSVVRKRNAARNKVHRDRKKALMDQQRHNICFYTGLQLSKLKKGGRGQLALSIEHLIPVSALKQGKHRIRNNMVPCMAMLNSGIGNAPLTVKFAFKEYLKGFTVHPALPQDEIVKIYQKAMRDFLEPYKIYGAFPWGWKGYNVKKDVSKLELVMRKARLRQSYELLLTEEELAVGAHNMYD